MTPPLLKTSPLEEAYRRNGAHFMEEQGWMMPSHCGNLDREKAHLQEGSLLVDWSHIDKITLRGDDAAQAASKLNTRAKSLKPLRSLATINQVILRLTSDEFLILCQPDKANKVLEKAQAPQTMALLHGGGLGCLVLTGARRDEVLERSSAMNLRRDLVPTGSVVQTTIHMVPCTIYRTQALDILLHTRDFSESLFEALMDVGHGVGLMLSGLEALPVSFALKEKRS